MNIIDLHTHTIVSGHAYSSLEENIEGALRNNIKILGISDHASTMPGGPHPFYFLNMKIIPNIIKGVRILKGIEANIIDFKGNIDVQPVIQEKMDYMIASLHPPVLHPGTLEENTQTLLKVMEIPKVKVIGHPDDGRYPLDYKKIVLKAKETKTLLEINNASLSPNGTRVDTKKNALEILKLCKLHNTPIILGSDAHISYDIGNFSNGIILIDEIEFPKELIMNNDLTKFYSYTKIEE